MPTTYKDHKLGTDHRAQHTHILLIGARSLWEAGRILGPGNPSSIEFYGYAFKLFD